MESPEWCAHSGWGLSGLHADGEPRGAACIPVALSADGEALGIFQADGTTLIDSVTFGAQRTDVSHGRTVDGAATWGLFSPASPGAANASPLGN